MARRPPAIPPEVVVKPWRIERKQPDGTWQIWTHPNHKTQTRFETFEKALSAAGRVAVREGRARVGKDMASPTGIEPVSSV